MAQYGFCFTALGLALGTNQAAEPADLWDTFKSLFQTVQTADPPRITITGKTYLITAESSACPDAGDMPRLPEYSGNHYDSHNSMETSITLSFPGREFRWSRDYAISNVCSLAEFHQGTYDTEDVLVDTGLYGFDTTCDGSLDIVVKMMERLDGSGLKDIVSIPHLSPETKPLHEAYVSLQKIPPIAKDLGVAGMARQRGSQE